ncbi:ATP-dependent DNA ligase [Pilimelia columellifera]|uniref:DNA ligase (ATP) n=1 Tax=Pilimelia columellifera subsp. columellifera TaxID=706583 RepID=A0ABP6AYR5_9ACTN
MSLPISPPIEPMLAKVFATGDADVRLPEAPGMSYEPKWDGYRCIVFRDGDAVELASRGGKSLTRYFPEMVERLRERLPPRIVVDGELVVIRRDTDPPRLDFDLLGQRIHPAASRVRMLAEATPADFVAFDLLAVGDDDLMAFPYAQRRARLAEALRGVGSPVHLTASTDDPAVARRWFTELEGAGLDGLIAKPADIPYAPGKRLMLKVKHARTADCVLAGFRWHTSGPVVGSLLLGLYDDEGRLHHVGVCASFTARRRAELVDELATLREEVTDHPWADAGADGQTRRPGAPSRWSGAKKSMEFVPLRPELVVEVGYDAMEGDRFRHTAQFVRWRPDRDPRSCGYAQLERPLRYDVTTMLAGSAGSPEAP